MLNRSSLTTGFLVAVASCIGSALHADWPAFRGPTRDGIVTAANLPIKWAPESANISWRTEIPGEGWSSPTIVGQNVFLTAAIPQGDSNGYSLSLIRIDASSGRIEWQRPLFEEPSDAPKIHSKNSHASPTVVAADGKLFVHFGHQGTACTDFDGNILWRNDSLGYKPVHGNGGSPALVGDLLIFSRDGASESRITALAASSGDVVWETAREVEADRKFSFCTPWVGSIDGRQQLILPGSNVVQSVDPRTGKEIWRARYDGYSVIPRPILHGGLIFVCTGYNKPSLLAIDPTGQGDVTDTHIRWTSKSNIPHTPSLIGYQGAVVAVSDNGIATAFAATSGEQLWKERIGGNFSASPILAGSNLYLTSEQGDCTVIDISGPAPEQISKNSMGERCLASPAILAGDLLLRTDQALYRIASE